MKKREEIILSNLQSKPFLIAFAVFLATVFAVGWCVLVWNENRVVGLDAGNISEAVEGEFLHGIEELVWQEDGVSITKDYVRITGWIVKPGEEILTSAIWVVLKDVQKGKYYRLPTELTDRADGTEWMDDGLSYTLSGFHVEVPRWKALDTDADYEIYVLDVLNGTSRLVSLDTTIKTWTKDAASEGLAVSSSQADN